MPSSNYIPYYILVGNFGKLKIWGISPQSELVSYKFGGMTSWSIVNNRQIAAE